MNDPGFKDSVIDLATEYNPELNTQNFVEHNLNESPQTLMVEELEKKDNDLGDMTRIKS